MGDDKFLPYFDGLLSKYYIGSRENSCIWKDGGEFPKSIFDKASCPDVEKMIYNTVPRILAFIRPILHDFIQDQKKEDEILRGFQPSEILTTILEEYIASGMINEHLDAMGYSSYFEDYEITIVPSTIEIQIVNYLIWYDQEEMGSSVKRYWSYLKTIPGVDGIVSF
jgi:hypothetical protein